MSTMTNASADDRVLDAATTDERVRWTVAHATNGARFFHDRFVSAGVDPDEVRGVGDLPRLPFTTKEDLREHGPWGWTAVPMSDVVRIHSSSGTTGRRTICTYTAADVESWTQQFARCYRYAGVGPEDRVQIAVGYGLWTAGVGFQAGAERIGAMAIPTGPGNTDMQVQMMRELGATTLGATASFALLLAEKLDDEGVEVDLRTGIFGSERWGEQQRATIERKLGIDSYDIYGLTELWGPGTGIECHLKDGMHVWSDHYIVEIIDPETLERVPDGEQGEVVLTTLAKEATPLVRYRTRDLSRLIPGPCACGSPYPRIERLSGRTDDATKVRGVLLLPKQVDVVLAECTSGDPTGEFQLHVDRDEHGRDIVLCRAEGDVSSAFGHELEEALHRRVGIRFDVEIVPPGTLPRSERKTQRMFDHRES